VTNLNDLLAKALPLWLRTTGFDPDARSFSSASHGWGSWELLTHTKEFNEAQDIDSTGLTTYLLLRDTYTEYLKAQTASAFDWITNRAEQEADVARLSELWELLQDPEALAYVDSFRSAVLASCEHYGVEVLSEDFSAWLDTYGLGVLRRDALRAAERLQVHQFAQGDRDPELLQYNPKVVEFWNMNSLLAALRGQKLPGITLVLIRDPEVMHSFFCFAVRDGDNITILTDKQHHPHPDYKRMARRPDRELVKRAEQFWFPYELLDLKPTEDAKALYASARTALVPVNSEAVALTDLKSCNPATVIWSTLVFELIREKFQNQGFKTPDLSYTGEMIRDPHALVGEHGALVRKGLYRPLELGELTPENVVGESKLQHEPAEHNQWMIDRYGESVPDEVFTVVGEHEALVLTDKHLPTPTPRWGWERDEQSRGALRSLDPQTFGTKEEISADRAWVARKNQCKIIQRRVNEEFIRERDAAIEWYNVHVRRNANALLDAVVRGSFVVVGFRFGGFARPDEMKARDLLWLPSTEKSEHLDGWKKGPPALGRAGDVQVWHGGWRDPHCWDRPEFRASVFGVLRPETPTELAAVCRVAVDDLPWSLQHWWVREPYAGNSILQRLDPADHISNPWVKGANPVDGGNHKDGLRLHVGLGLCKRAYNVRAKGGGE
jgi:hypothetical protein